MHLLDSELRNKEEWEAAGIELPKFDREAMKAATRECPQWVHFGAGNIFRAFPAASLWRKVMTMKSSRRHTGLRMT